MFAESRRLLVSAAFLTSASGSHSEMRAPGGSEPFGFSGTLGFEAGWGVPALPGLSVKSCYGKPAAGKCVSLGFVPFWPRRLGSFRVQGDFFFFLQFPSISQVCSPLPPSHQTEGPSPMLQTPRCAGHDLQMEIAPALSSLLWFGSGLSQNECYEGRNDVVVTGLNECVCFTSSAILRGDFRNNYFAKSLQTFMY